jgi:hypothetical protein
VDETAGELTPPAVRFRPYPWLTALAGVGTVIAVVLAWLAADAPSRLIFGIAAVVAGAYAIGDVVFAPRLSADRTGVRIRTPMTRADLRWDEIEAVRVDTRDRLGLRSTTLEIDTGEAVVVFSRRSLGADPEFAARKVRAFADPRTFGG